MPKALALNSFMESWRNSSDTSLERPESWSCLAWSFEGDGLFNCPNFLYEERLKESHVDQNKRDL